VVGRPHGGLRLRARAFEQLIEELLMLSAQRAPELAQTGLPLGQNHTEWQDYFPHDGLQISE